MYKYTLDFKLYLIDLATNDKELVESKKTSPLAFFDHYPVHYTKFSWERKGDSIVVTEMALHKNKVYQAEVSDPDGGREMMSILVQKLGSR